MYIIDARARVCVVVCEYFIVNSCLHKHFVIVVSKRACWVVGVSCSLVVN